jgi:hypothetical protein
LGSSSIGANISCATIAIRTSSGNLQTDRTFTGQKQDGTGLLYMNARYYDIFC